MAVAPGSKGRVKSKSKRPTTKRGRGPASNVDEPTQKSTPRVKKASGALRPQKRTSVHKEVEKKDTTTEEEPSSVIQKKKPVEPKKKPVEPTSKVDTAIQEFMDHHTKIENVQKDLEQFHQQSTKIDEENSKTERHEKCCQQNWRSRYPEEHCLDGNRVILLKDDGQEGEFYHASKCRFDGLPDRPYILAQAPMATTAEDFWKMIFQEQSSAVVMLCEFYEDGKEASEPFWPMTTGEYKYYGTMFINNKKKETKDKLTLYTIEVLPDGCSNSLITIVYHYTLWKPKESAINARLLLNIHNLTKLQEKESMTVVSSRGTGRSAVYTAVDVILVRLLKGLKTRVLDVVLELKKQRAGSICLDLQYHEIQRLVLHYLASKMKKYLPVYQKYQTDLTDMLNKEAIEKKEDDNKEEKPADSCKNSDNE